MGIGKVLLTLLVVFVVAMVALGGCVVGGYNKAVRLDEEVKNRWAQVENQLQRRYELIPNLVETVKGVAAQEKDIFLGIAKAREAYFASERKGVNEKAKAASEFEGEYRSALSRLLVLQERYPELRSNESFLKLQDSLEGTENRLSVERQRFNEGVRELNTFTRTVLGRLYSGLAGVEKAEYFDAPESAQTAPKVSFTKEG